MSCTQCLKINPIPECLGAYAGFEISNLTFPGTTGDLKARLLNLATGAVLYFDFTVGDIIDLSEAFPLMPHWYKLDFITEFGVPVTFIITNPDDTTSQGCCMEFTVSESLEWDGGEYDLSTTNCVVE